MDYYSRIGSIQPAEYLKLVAVWFLSATFASKQEKIRTYDLNALFDRNQFWVNFITGWRVWMVAMIGAVVIMPDMGNALLIIISSATVLAVSGVLSLGNRLYENIWPLTLAILALLKITGGNVIPSFFGSIAYVNKRFIAFANPFQEHISK